MKKLKKKKNNKLKEAGMDNAKGADSNYSSNILNKITNAKKWTIEDPKDYVRTLGDDNTPDIEKFVDIYNNTLARVKKENKKGKKK